jgi:hypothetical protein
MIKSLSVGLGLLAASTLTVALSVASCKKSRNSGDVKGVENLARANDMVMTDPLCGSSAASDAHSAALDKWLNADGVIENDEDQELVQQFRMAMAYAPIRLLETINAYREQGLLKINLHFEKGEPACNGIPSEDQTFFKEFTKTKNFSCFVKFPGQSTVDLYFGSIDNEKDFAEALKFYQIKGVQPSQESFVVRHEAVRNLALLYTRIIRGTFEKLSQELKPTVGSALVQSAQNPELKSLYDNLVAKLKKLEDDQKLLAEAFMADTANEALFSKQTAATLDKTAKALGPKNFRDFVFAEVFDSYFCNQATSSNLKKYYAATFKVFRCKFVADAKDPSRDFDQASFDSEAVECN